MFAELEFNVRIFTELLEYLHNYVNCSLSGILGWSGVNVAIGDRMHQVVHWIFVGNSAVNPIVFGLMNPLIR